MDRSEGSVEKDIERLYQMVGSRHFQDISWSRSGRCIVVRSAGEFNRITGPFFGFSGGVAELGRFLRSYGFAKVPGSRLLKYYNRLFRRGRRELFRRIRRVRDVSAGDPGDLEIESMNDGCLVMLREVEEVVGRVRENERRISGLRDAMFLLGSYMRALKPYHEAESMEYDASNRIRLGESMGPWRRRYLEGCGELDLGFLEEVKDAKRDVGVRRDCGGRRRESGRGLVKMRRGKDKFDGIVGDFQ